MGIPAKYIPVDSRHPRLTPRPKVPGEFRFVDDAEYEVCEPPGPGRQALLEYACPSGNGYCGAILVGNGFKPASDRPSWQWNGSLEAPTLTPSINCLSHGPGGEKYAGCGWHAWLTNGMWG